VPATRASQWQALRRAETGEIIGNFAPGALLPAVIHGLPAFLDRSLERKPTVHVEDLLLVVQTAVLAN
jgi:hypothetical protein